jgi:hypothetical protein
LVQNTRLLARIYAWYRQLAYSQLSLATRAGQGKGGKKKATADESEKGGAADVPSCNVPRWLQEVMSKDEITVLSEAMHQNQVHESDLEFIDNDILKKAGIVKGLSRAKILIRIRSMFKQEEE